MGSRYRGHYTKQPQYLDRALKIIIHISTAYSLRHRRRFHRPFEGVPPAPVPVLEPPPVDTGIRREHLRRHMAVEVWWAGDWWSATVTLIPVGVDTINVRFVGHDHTTTGILPKHIRIVAAR